MLKRLQKCLVAGAGKCCFRCNGEHSPTTCRFKNSACNYCHKVGNIVVFAGFGGEERPPDGAVGLSPTEHPELKVVTPDNSEIDGSLNEPWTPIFQPRSVGLFVFSQNT